MTAINRSIYNQIIAELKAGAITLEDLENRLYSGIFSYDEELEGIVYDLVSHGF